MARIINVKRGTFIGTVSELDALIRRWSGPKAAIINLDGCKFVVVPKVDAAELRKALKSQVRKKGARHGRRRRQR